MKTTAEQIREIQARIEARRVASADDRVIVYVADDGRHGPTPEYDGGPVHIYDADLPRPWESPS